MIDKPCCECGETLECLEGTEKEHDCIVLENGGCWDECDSGGKSEYHENKINEEKARHKKAVAINKEIVSYLDSKDLTIIFGGLVEISLKDCPGIIGQITKIIKKNL
jgi:hypothetical protein